MGRPAKTDPIKYCEYCGKQFFRKRLSTGLLMGYTAFVKLKLCSMKCSALAKIKIPAKINYCKTCGKELIRNILPSGTPEAFSKWQIRKYCSWNCRGCERGKPIEELSDPALTTRARKFVKDKCEICGVKEKLCVHHKNRNRTDNSKENIITVCRSDHMRIHHREDPNRQKKKCKICGEPQSGKLLCKKHYDHERKKRLKQEKYYTLTEDMKKEMKEMATNDRMSELQTKNP